MRCLSVEIVEHLGLEQAEFNMVSLVKPNEKYFSSFIEGIKEFIQIGEFSNSKLENILLRKEIEGISENFDTHNFDFKNNSNFVESSTFWLINSLNEYIGEARIRHNLNENLFIFGGHIGYEIRPSKRLKGFGKIILKESLKEASKLGINNVLLTCNEDNIGSRKIIESNGGILENIVLVQETRRKHCRYWIINNKG